MGNNAAWSDMEMLIIGIHNLGKLDTEVMDVIGKVRFQYPDIDMGGYYGTKAKDGKEMLQIVVELFDPGFQPAPQYDDDEEDEDGESYYDRFYELADERWRRQKL